METFVCSCKKCGKKQDIMKRCTRCKSSYYCSRECQEQDWPTHKLTCGYVHGAAVCNTNGQMTDTDISTDTRCVEHSLEKDIWKEHNGKHAIRQSGHISLCANEKESKNGTASKAVIDFEKAFKEAQNPQQTDSANKGNMYLYLNRKHYDAPSFDASKPSFTISVKANKSKLKIAVNADWNEKEHMKYFSHKLRIPLDKLKLIHKGKIVSQSNIKDVLVDKAVFQALGEPAEEEDGVDGKDIEVMMKQVSVERNVAIKALRETGDVIDAILKVTNK